MTKFMLVARRVQNVSRGFSRPTGAPPQLRHNKASSFSTAQQQLAVSGRFLFAERVDVRQGHGTLCVPAHGPLFRDDFEYLERQYETKIASGKTLYAGSSVVSSELTPVGPMFRDDWEYVERQYEETMASRKTTDTNGFTVREGATAHGPLFRDDFEYLERQYEETIAGRKTQKTGINRSVVWQGMRPASSGFQMENHTYAHANERLPGRALFRDDLEYMERQFEDSEGSVAFASASH